MARIGQARRGKVRLGWRGLSRCVWEQAASAAMLRLSDSAAYAARGMARVLARAQASRAMMVRSA